MREIFISYRRDDSDDISWRIYEKLQATFGADSIFKDVDTIPPGADFHQHLESALRQCTVGIVVIGQRWLGTDSTTGQRRIDAPNDFLRIEVETMLERKIRIIPVLVHGATMPSSTELPPSIRELSSRQARILRSGVDFGSDIQHVCDEIEIAVPVLDSSSGVSSGGRAANAVKAVPTTALAQDKVNFNLGCRVEGRRYQTQLVSLTRPREGTQDFHVSCHKCNEIVTVRCPSLKQAMTKTYGGTRAAGMIGLVVAAICFIFVSASPYLAIGGVIYGGLGLIALGVASGSKPSERQLQTIQKNKRAVQAFLPSIVAEHSREQSKREAREKHRLLTADKREFLATERKRGIRRMAVAVEDRL